MCGDFDNRLQAIITIGRMQKTMILAYLELAMTYDDNIWISLMLVMMRTVPSPLCFHKYGRYSQIWELFTNMVDDKWWDDNDQWWQRSGDEWYWIQTNYSSIHDSNNGRSDYGPSSPKPRAWSGLSANLTATSASTFCIWDTHSKECIWSYSTLKQWLLCSGSKHCS